MVHALQTDWLTQGYAYYKAERWEEAGVALEHAVAAHPGHAGAWYRLGNVRGEQGRDADAVECFEHAVALAPSDAKTWNNLGAARQRLGLSDEALCAYRIALQKDPELAQPYLNLGRLCENRGELEASAGYYRDGFARHPEDPLLEHLHAATSGVNLPRATRGYVATLFDDFAEGFDRHLEALEYRIPQALAQLLRPWLQAPSPVRVLDLGCGTGLAGAAVAAPGVELIGVDMSPRMLELAGERHLYSQLILGDAHEALEAIVAGSFRAVLAADLFIYIGDLEEVLGGAARVLERGGALAISIEALEGGTYRLQPTGRYAHSVAYVRTLAARLGLEVKLAGAVDIRREKHGFANGQVLLLERL